MIWPSALIALAHVFAWVTGAVLSAGACVWLWRHGERSRPDRTGLMVASAASAIWCALAAGLGAEHNFVTIAAMTRNLALIATIFSLFAADGRSASLKPVRPVILALVLVQLLQPVVLFVGDQIAGVLEAESPARAAGLMIDMLVAIGALMLLHNLYAGAANALRPVLRWTGMALAGIFAYDLNLHTLSYLGGETPAALRDLRGIFSGTMAVLFALGMNAAGPRVQFSPSRAVTFRTLSLLLIGAYIAGLVLVTKALALIGGDAARAGQAVFAVIGIVAAAFALPSPRLRGWLRVTATKHLFQHGHPATHDSDRVCHVIAPDSAIINRHRQKLRDLTCHFNQQAREGGLLPRSLCRPCDPKTTQPPRHQQGHSPDKAVRRLFAHRGTFVERGPDKTRTPLGQPKCAQPVGSVGKLPRAVDVNQQRRLQPQKFFGMADVAVRNRRGHRLHLRVKGGAQRLLRLILGGFPPLPDEKRQQRLKQQQFRDRQQHVAPVKRCKAGGKDRQRDAQHDNDRPPRAHPAVSRRPKQRRRYHKPGCGWQAKVAHRPARQQGLQREGMKPRSGHDRRIRCDRRGQPHRPGHRKVDHRDAACDKCGWHPPGHDIVKGQQRDAVKATVEPDIKWRTRPCATDRAFQRRQCHAVAVKNQRLFAVNAVGCGRKRHNDCAGFRPVRSLRSHPGREDRDSSIDRYGDRFGKGHRHRPGSGKGGDKRGPVRLRHVPALCQPDQNDIPRRRSLRDHDCRVVEKPVKRR